MQAAARPLPLEHTRKSPLRPPRHLSKSSKRWWAKIIGTWQLEPHHVELLSQAAGCLDRMEAARLVVATEGAIIRDRFNIPREHPAAKQERDEKLLFAKLCREMNLDPEPSEPSRPPLIADRYKSR